MKLEDKAPEIRKSLKQCMDIMKGVTPDKITQQEINEVRQQLNFSLTNLETEPQVHVSDIGNFTESNRHLTKQSEEKYGTGKVVGVFMGRSGFDHWWDTMDQDVRDEIIEELDNVLGKS